MAERVQDILDAAASERRGPFYDAVSAARRRAGDRGMAGLQKEILGEMASALGRAEEHVTASLARLRELDAAIVAAEKDAAEGLATARDIQWRVAAYNAEVGVAERRLWELMVHREALGFRRHDVLAELYPVPRRRAVTSR